MITVGSLFSGIGGLELGLERTGKFKTIWNCENDEYASAILRKHWPEIPNLGDITKVEWERIEKPNLLCGGFPCQDISIAGKQKGIKEGTRSGLWFEFAKAIRIIRPRYVLIENVPMLANNGGTIVLSSLAEIGYDAEWFTLSAAEVGAWHKRERFFIIAYSNSLRSGCNNGDDNREGGYFPTNEKRIVEKAFEGEQGKRITSIGEMGDVSNPNGSRQQKSWFSIAAKAKQFAIKCPGEWKTEPALGRVANGIPNFVDRIKCLGNAVVPQVAQVIGKAIAEYDEVNKI
jgi:DNA (cytosine-5)-methyltransferase 1